MQTTHEPLTAKQRKELQGYISWGVRTARVVIYFIAVIFVGACLRSIHHTFLSQPVFAWDVWWLVPTLAFATWLARRAKNWTGGTQGVNDIKADLAEGNIAVHRITVMDAIEMEQAEDEGASYFILTDDKKVIYFHGQEMDRWKRHGFPWQEFEIRETPRSKMLFSLKQQGARFAPTIIRKPLSFAEVKNYSGNFKGHYRILEVDFESLKTDALAGSNRDR